MSFRVGFVALLLALGVGSSWCGPDPFLGEISMFAGNFAPRGWAFCHGQLLPISPNAALFSLLTTTYGGDGRTTFALPDLRERAPIGAGDGFNEIGATVALPAHTHNIDLSGGTFSISAGTPLGTISGASLEHAHGPVTVPETASAPHNHSLPDVPAHTHTVSVLAGTTDGTSTLVSSASPEDATRCAESLNRGKCAGTWGIAPSATDAGGASAFTTSSAGAVTGESTADSAVTTPSVETSAVPAGGPDAIAVTTGSEPVSVTGGGTVTTTSAGGATQDNMPAFIKMNYNIAVQGTFPSRS